MTDQNHAVPDIVRDIEGAAASDGILPGDPGPDATSGPGRTRRVPEAEAYESLTPETAESGQDNGLSE